MSNLKIVHKSGGSFIDPQGSKANKNGKRLEDLVEAELCKYNIDVLSYNEWVTDITKISDDVKGVLFKNVPYINVYGSKGRSEFLLFLDGFLDTRIECRSQLVTGSVDEKLPYLLENCKAFDEKNVIVVLEGNGYRTRAKEWFVENAHAVRFKNINVMSLKEFKDWAKGILAQ